MSHPADPDTRGIWGRDSAGFRRGLVLVLAAGLALSLVRPPFPRLVWLQNAPTVLMLLLLWFLPRRWAVSRRALACIGCFLAAHILGARWIYSFVPLDDWIRALAGVSLREAFHLTRNPYDRFVHLLFGLTAVRPLWEVFVRHARAPRGWGLACATLAVFALSLSYEVFEWGLTMVLAPADAGAYNGEQGDRFDAQKDMALAAAGALAACVLCAWRGRAAGNGRLQGEGEAR